MLGKLEIKKLFLVLAMGSSSVAFAASVNPALQHSSQPATQHYLSLSAFAAKLKPVFILTTGATYAQVGKSQSFSPIDLCSYNYNPRNADYRSMIWGAFAGSQVWSSRSWAFTAGLGYYQPSSLGAKGTLSQGADTVSASIYGYSYQVKTQQLLAEGKLSLIKINKLQPYLSLGVGAAFNKAYDYQTNVPAFLEFTPSFSSHQQTNFSYAAGAGVDFVLSPSFLLGVGYRFTDLGKANLGSGQIDSIAIPNTLKQSHLYANQILAQLTYSPYR